MKNLVKSMKMIQIRKCGIINQTKRKMKMKIKREEIKKIFNIMIMKNKTKKRK